ncbi:MAG: bifunctional folylpolyglutamate synthase/dihydrofolate synthase [Myxococcales bacterium]|nr:bifunctional folylpolyglutamate synthase/dihydrofolate synthase [Myxococcales bacterium]
MSRSDYAAAIERLFAMQSRGIRLGVSRMHQALDFRGRPDRGMRFIQVAGTNGKGSVATLIARGLQAAGYRTGLFTSPHLHRYVERVRIDGRPLGEAEAARRIRALLDAFDGPDAPETTFFELTTLLAIETFVERRCDVAVLEVGLGGRLDATTAVQTELSVITRIALDHRRILGDTLALIAREKAGILKPGVPLISGVREREARAVIARRARRLGVPVWWAGRDFELEPGSGASFGVRLPDARIDGLRLGLRGQHQRENATIAVAALHRLRDLGFALDDAAIAAGLRKARWAGRIERVAGEPNFLFDAAHNPDGAEALRAYLAGERRAARSGPGLGRRVLLFGAMADKDYPAMLRMLAPLCDRVIYCAPDMRRAATTGALQKVHPGSAARGMADALNRAKRAAGKGGEVVVAGSIFLVAEARAAVTGVRSDPLIRM